MQYVILVMNKRILIDWSILFHMYIVCILKLYSKWISKYILYYTNFWPYFSLHKKNDIIYA